MAIGKLGRDRRGVSTTEFALTAPLLLTMLIGMLQIDRFFLADAGIERAVESAARYATIYPAPTDDQIRAKLEASKFGLSSSHVSEVTLTHGTSNGVAYVDISMNYQMPMNFIMFDAASLPLSHTRRAYLP